MAEVTVFAGKPTLNAVVVGVTFVDGIGVCDTTDLAKLAFFTRQGWTQTLTSTLDYDPADITIETVKPVASATKAELLAYATANAITVSAAASKTVILQTIDGFTDAVAVVITVQPEPQSAADAATATFDVTATGSPLAYQWQRQVLGAGAWANVAGGTTASLDVVALTANDTDKYRVIISNAKGAVTSNAVALTVT